MNLKRTLIAILLIVAGGLLHNLPIPKILPTIILIFGVFLFAAFFDHGVFMDYATFEDGKYVLSVRMRYYYNYIPLSLLLNLLRMDLKFVYRAEYYKIVSPTKDLDGIDIPSCKISKEEYKQLLQHQKQQYLNKSVPQDLVAEICAPQEVRVTRAKISYLIPLILALLMLTAATDPAPSSWIMAACFGGLLAWLAIIRRGEYKEAKFKNDAYNSYFTSTPQ